MIFTFILENHKYNDVYNQPNNYGGNSGDSNFTSVLTVIYNKQVVL